MPNVLKKIPNAISVTCSLIKKLNIPVSGYTIKNDLEEHPDYPSLLAINDSLNSWNVPNQALQLDKETCNIEELPLPLIAHLKIDGGQLLLINEIHRNMVYFSNEKTPGGRLSKEEFLKAWDGVMLYVEKDDMSGETNYRQALVKGFFAQARSPFFVATVLLVVLYAINYNSVSWAYACLLVIKFSGIAISTLLLMHCVNSQNPFIKNLCSLGKKNDCNTILKSDAATVTSWLSWSEVGLFYFSGSFICLLLDPSGTGFTSWLNLLYLPFTFYSLCWATQWLKPLSPWLVIHFVAPVR
jgi:hypothetical protein